MNKLNLKKYKEPCNNVTYVLRRNGTVYIPPIKCKASDIKKDDEFYFEKASDGTLIASGDAISINGDWGVPIAV